MTCPWWSRACVCHVTHGAICPVLPFLLPFDTHLLRGAGSCGAQLWGLMPSSQHRSCFLRGARVSLVSHP